MILTAAILLVLQAVPPPAETVFQSRSMHILVPHGWKPAEPESRSSVIRLEHSSGASFEVRRAGSGTQKLKQFAERGLEQVWLPLGFVSLGDPLERKLRNDPAIQYKIIGNRLSERRKLSYIAVFRIDGALELIYENSEDQFELLSSEAERIASSVQPVTEANEEQAQRVLRSLQAAEGTYFSINRRYGSFEDLVAAGLADVRLKEVHFGYRYRLTLTRDGYQVEATPARQGQTGRFVFQAGHDGIVSSRPRDRL